MIIDQFNALAFWTHILDDNGNRRAFKWIDPIKKTGTEMVYSSYDAQGFPEGNELHTLEWKEDNPFPYNVLIRDPETDKENINPCIHDLEDLERTAIHTKQIIRAEIKEEKRLMKDPVFRRKLNDLDRFQRENK